MLVHRKSCQTQSVRRCVPLQPLGLSSPRPAVPAVPAGSRLLRRKRPARSVRVCAPGTQCNGGHRRQRECRTARQRAQSKTQILQNRVQQRSFFPEGFGAPGPLPRKNPCLESPQPSSSSTAIVSHDYQGRVRKGRIVRLWDEASGRWRSHRLSSPALHPWSSGSAVPCGGSTWAHVHGWRPASPRRGRPCERRRRLLLRALHRRCRRRASTSQ